MILGDDLAQAATRVLEQQEALDEVEEARGFTGGPKHRLQRHALRTVLLQTLPGAKLSNGAWLAPIRA